MTAAKRNPAAYITNLSAVKNIQRWKSGMEISKQIKPAHTSNRGFLIKSNVTNIIINSISCGFMFSLL